MTLEFCSVFIRNTVKQGLFLAWLVQTKFNMTTLCLDNHRQSFWQLSSVCPGLPEPMSQSELASADQCLKFCDDTPFTATLPTLNNPRDLDMDCLEASFLV